jgi:DNA polymerase-3 subunit delta'
MSDLIYPWQQESWRALQDMRARLPHALLLHGPVGIGKTRFAEAFARSLLCETPTADGHGCGTCLSCGWFEQYSHPDYRRVRPEMLDEDEAGEGADGEAVEEPKKAAKTKAPSKDIRIDQIRALGDFMNISTHRQGKRVVLLYPAEALNGAAANALLKTLEEPPPETMIVLVSNSLDRLLPTILSRCRKFALPMPGQAEALAWLKTQGIQKAGDAELYLAEQGGSPLAALEQAEGGSREVLDEFLAHLARPGVEAALKTADRLAKTPPAELVGLLQRWLYDLSAYQLSGRIRYYPRYRKELAALAARVQTGDLLRAVKATNDRRAIADHPLAAKLFIEEMLLQYAALFA